MLGMIRVDGCPMKDVGHDGEGALIVGRFVPYRFEFEHLHIREINIKTVFFCFD